MKTPVYITTISLPVLYFIGFIILWTNSYETPRFSMLSNITFVLSGVSLYLSLKSRTNITVPFLDAAPLVLVLLGAASFAFHVDNVMNTTRHTLDIFFGWIVLLHASFELLISCVANAFYKYKSKAPCTLSYTNQQLPTDGSIIIWATLSAFFFSGVVVTVSVFYDKVYGVQQLFFVIVVLFSSLSTLVSAFTINLDLHESGEFKGETACCNCDKCCNRKCLNGFGCRSNGGHLFTSFIMLLSPACIAISAVFLQSEIIGVQHRHSSIEYDLWHANWHFLLALLCLWLYSRAAYIAGCDTNKPSDYEPENTAIWVLISLYALTGLLLKEMDIDAQISTIVMFSFSLAIAVYIIVLIYSKSSGQKDAKNANSKSSGQEDAENASDPPRLKKSRLPGLVKLTQLTNSSFQKVSREETSDMTNSQDV